MTPTTLIILITVTGVVAVGLAVRGVIRRELSAITAGRGLDPGGGLFREVGELEVDEPRGWPGPLRLPGRLEIGRGNR